MCYYRIDSSILMITNSKSRGSVSLGELVHLSEACLPQRRVLECLPWRSLHSFTGRYSPSALGKSPLDNGPQNSFMSQPLELVNTLHYISKGNPVCRQKEGLLIK